MSVHAGSACEIYSVAHRHSFRWKWRPVRAGGPGVDCAEEYEAFFDCVRAARAHGYEPQSNWARIVLAPHAGR